MDQAADSRGGGRPSRIDSAATMGRRLILWDIDGTLVWWGPIGRGVFDDAIHDVVGRDPAGHGVSMGGKTDPQIALEIMDTLALDDGEAADRRGIAFDPDDVWVVGDTPRDLVCARVVGAHCALVATGRNAGDLDGLGADVVWRDLSDVDAVVAVLAPERDEAAG